MNELYDLIIIGSGPAGLTAGIYAGRAELHTVIIEKNAISGGQIINTYEVDNYPGIPGISGFELADKFREHCERSGVLFAEGEVETYSLKEEVKEVILNTGVVYKGKTVIIAAGAVWRKLGVKGEDEFAGRGVSYCATCDGAFFRNKTAAVVGGGDVALEDAVFLARMCETVYIIHRRNEFRGAKTLVAKVKTCINIKIIWDSVVEEIVGQDKVESLRIKNLMDNSSRKLEVSGVFIAVGTMPASPVYKEYLETDEAGYIVAGETCETNIPGVYAAGDIRTKPLKQVITAAADGANAITTVEKYLNSL